MERQWLPLIRAAYQISDSTDEWLRELAQAALRVMDCGSGVIAFRYVINDTTGFEPCEIVHVSAESTARFENFREFLKRIPSEWHPQMPHSPAIHHTISERVLSSSELLSDRGVDVETSLRETLQDSEYFDALITRIEIDEHGGFLLVAPSKEMLEPPLVDRARWAKTAQHIRSGWLIANRLQDGVNRTALDTTSSQARRATDVLFPILSDVRSDTRRPQRQLWDGLLDGTHSVVDYYTEHLRARHYILVRNQPQLALSRALNDRERAAVSTFARTASGVEVAIQLDVAESTVRQYLRSAMCKLGLRHRSELLQIAFAAGVLRRKTTSSDLRPPEKPSHHAAVRTIDDELSILSIPMVPSFHVMQMLTDAEREICRYVMLGWSTDQIAGRRCTSERTVANQLASIFRKLGITDRFELAHRLLGAKKDGSHIVES